MDGTGGRQAKNTVARHLCAMTLRLLTTVALWMALVLFADAYANTTYRVGRHVLVVGDDTSRVRVLLGNPQSISRGTHVGGRLPGQNAKRRHRGVRDRKGPRRYQATRWHYQLDSKHVVVTIVSGRVVDIASGR
ncbi:hypothetical protein [Dyella sp. GSA-30]|uniref:hypothetical protein n=1 Tax=Dyella sp. GSA-30 TaxID=2994496 RepID=UPI002491AC3F|nr:hypothetical protein [Dyella sp. GSA-30]BDU18725.1 hypothetical protein DYGSA30_01820 [Dyella sp. GSA-30]